MTFDTGATESVVSKLNQIKDASSENENSTSRVIDNYDNSYKEKFENLYKKYELAQEERQEIE